MPLKSYRELDVWKTAMDLVEAVYVLAAVFPTSERAAWKLSQKAGQMLTKLIASLQPEPRTPNPEPRHTRSAKPEP